MPVEKMKHAVAFAITMLLLCHISAFAGGGFVLEIGCFDPEGALTTTQNGDTPLPDGCLGQVILDAGDDGVAVPATDGSPGEGDALLRVSNGYQRADGSSATFTVNGAASLNMPGRFLSLPVAGMSAPVHRVFIRVWNAADPQQATGYWDSPLCQILSGPQQISFARSEWNWNTFGSSGHKDIPVVSRSALSAYPNPFNSSSRISFDLREDEIVTLAVYDLQARLVTTLLNGPQSSGHHDLSFNGTALPSGIYFVRLQAGHEGSQITRLLLLK
jgi:hypothetical protein